MKAWYGVSRRWRFSFVAIYALMLLSPFFSSIQAPLRPASATAASYSPATHNLSWRTGKTGSGFGNVFIESVDKSRNYSPLQGYWNIITFDGTQWNNNRPMTIILASGGGDAKGYIAINTCRGFLKGKWAATPGSSQTLEDGTSVTIADDLVSEQAVIKALGTSGETGTGKDPASNPNYKPTADACNNAGGGVVVHDDATRKVNVTLSSQVDYKLVNLDTKKTYKATEVDDVVALYKDVNYHFSSSDFELWVAGKHGATEGSVLTALTKGYPDDSDFTFQLSHDDIYGLFTRVPGGALFKPNTGAVLTKKIGDSFDIPYENMKNGTTYMVCIKALPNTCGTFTKQPNQIPKITIDVSPDKTRLYFSTVDVAGAGGKGSGGDACVVHGLISFIACPAIDLANSFYDGVKGQVEKVLDNGTLDPSDPNVANARLVWSQFRALTNIVFVLVFLAIIFSTTLSLGLSNYDIKKMLPRLVVAVILVQFSWVLMQLAFDVSNILAAGIKAFPIFTANIGKGGTTPAASWAFSGAIAGVFTVVILEAALLIPFLLVLLSAVLGILAVFLTLFIRQFIIIILVVLSPLALVAWVLPNTENIFKTWSKMLLRLLFMYPLIVLIFSMAGLFSKITPSCGQHIVNGVLVGECKDINSVVAGIIPILAFYMVPWTFKWAGGAMAAVGGYVTGKASGWGKSARQPFNKELRQRYGQHTANRAADKQIKAGDLFSRGGVSALRARAMTGNFGKRGDARLAAGAIKAQQEQVKAERDKLVLAAESERAKNPGFNEGAWLATRATTGSVHQQQAAQEAMIDKGMIEDLSKIAGTGLDGSLSWQRTKSEKWGDIRDKAGYLLEDGTLDQKLDKFARKVSKSQLATQKKDSLDQLFRYAAAHKGDTAPSAADPTSTVAASVSRLKQTAIQTYGTPKIMDNVNVPEAETIEKISNI